MKARLPYLFAFLITMILGYSSRSFAAMLPTFVAEHFGDALWAGMIYFGFRFVWVAKRLGIAVIASFVFSFAIETSQLYQADWIQAIRSHPLGALVLGNGFLALDLVRYSAGIAVAWFIDSCILNKLVRKKSK